MQENRFAAAWRGALALAACWPAFALAQPATPGVDQRQANQERRIQQGVRSGELTRREAARLQRGQERVEKMEEHAKADGQVTPKEKARLKRAQDRQSAAIYKEKHDGQADLNRDGRKDGPRRRH
jgi:hypothetical protein